MNFPITQIGLIFLAAASLMILSLCRDLIPADLRRIARIATGVLAAALLAMAAWRHGSMPTLAWPSWGARKPVASQLPAAIAEPPKPATKRPAIAPRKPFGTIRDISPEEAERLMEQIRTRKEIPVGR